MEEGGEELCDENRFIENRLDGTLDHFRTMLLWPPDEPSWNVFIAVFPPYSQITADTKRTGSFGHWLETRCASWVADRAKNVRSCCFWVYAHVSEVIIKVLIQVFI